MDNNFNPTLSEAYPETMDFLWCNFAVQALNPEELQDRSIVLLDDSIKKFDQPDTKGPFTRMDNSIKMDDADFNSLPPWKSNDVKSWIWIQQAMHPELNYSSCFRKKWLSWKMPFKTVSIKKWLRDIKQKRKEKERLQRAQVNAATSVAGLAAALAAIAAENAKRDDSSTTKEAAVATAAALVAAQCAKIAEGMGAKRELLSSVTSSALVGTNASDILTLTATASTSLKGAATLEARSKCKNILNGSSTPVLPIEDNINGLDFDFEKCRSLLAKGTELGIETSDGKYIMRLVSIILNRDAKVILKLRKLNLLKSKKESVILNLHAELYRDSDADVQETETCYLLVLTTNMGKIKLDMADDYQRYKMWATTINQMLMLF